MRTRLAAIRFAVVLALLALLVIPGMVSAARRIIDADLLDGLDSTEFVRTDQTQHYSCLGADMAPRDQATEYADLTHPFEGRYLTTSARGTFSCAVHLPDGATVTGFSGDLFDVMDVGDGYCELYWTQADGLIFPLAVTPSSGFFETPGDINLVAASISQPVIDNAQYAYSASCHLHATSTISEIDKLLLTKVTVTYVGAP